MLLEIKEHGERERDWTTRRTTSLLFSQRSSRRKSQREHLGASQYFVVMDEPISVSINDFATEKELEAIQEAFRLAGIDAKVKANYFMKSADLVPWIVSISLAYPAGAFFSGFFGKLGADAAVGMQEWVRRLRKVWESSPALPGSVVIRGKDGTTVVIGDPPEEAFDALLTLDWEKVEGDYLLWNTDAGEWRNKMPR